jgi:hypothetical protein
MSDGPFARARFIERNLRGAIDDIGIVTIDQDALQPVSRGTIRRRLRHGRHITDRRVLHVRLFSQTKITGSFHTAAKLRRLVKAPIFVVPSPKKQTDTSLSPLY